MASHLLLIADDPDELQLFTLVLERAGYRITAATYAREALELLRNTHFDLILTDYMLPDINGDELIPRMRAITDTKIILMSNHIDVRYIASQARADGCFPKFNAIRLPSLVATLLGHPSADTPAQTG